jgi:hypothetical protein
MEAVVECVIDNAPPPAELSLAWQCDRWHTLPFAGGLYLQDYRTMLLMTVTSNIHHAVSRIRSLKGKDIHRLTEPERRIIRMLMDHGILFR